MLDMKTKLATIIIVIIIITTVAISFYFRNNDQERVIIMTTLNLPLNTTEVYNIDYIYSKNILEENNISFYDRNNITEPDEHIQFSGGDIQNSYMYVGIYFNTSSEKGWVNALDNKPVSELSLDAKKEYLVNIVNNMAIACNITIDWSKAEWTVIYQD